MPRPRPTPVADAGTAAGTEAYDAGAAPAGHVVIPGAGLRGARQTVLVAP
jgi:hypothetical protein